MKHLLVFLAVALLFVGVTFAQAPAALPDAPSAGLTQVFAAGVSYNAGGTPALAGTGLYAHKVSDSGTFAFTVVDALPATVRPFTVTTNFTVGIAQKVVTIANVPIYIPTSAGVSYNGTNTGWAWSTGAMASIKVKDNWYILPNVRFLKSSVSNGTGYQPIVGVMVGWGQ